MEVGLTAIYKQRLYELFLYGARKKIKLDSDI